MSDIIDALVGIAPGSKLDTIRAERPEARKHSQTSYDALFSPAKSSSFGVDERFAIAAFVAGLHREPQTVAHYEQQLPAGLRAAVATEIEAAKSEGPYGRFPRGPLSAEDAPGPSYRAGEQGYRAVGPKLAAAFEHVHMLVFHPRDASAGSLQKLLDAGWSTTDVVTLSQLVSFLAYQIRVVAGLRVLAAAS